MEAPEVRRAVAAGRATASALGLQVDDVVGPIEFDVAHVLEEAEEHYPGADRDLIRRCCILTLALFTAWRWRRDDQLPNGHYWRTEGSTRFEQHLTATGWTGLDPSRWHAPTLCALQPAAARLAAGRKCTINTHPAGEVVRQPDARLLGVK